MSTTEPQGGENDIEGLLPWFATGRLPAAEVERVRRALAGDAELRRRLELVEEEQAETVRLNAAIAEPSGGARDDLFTRIAVAERRAPRAAAVPARRSLAERLAGLVASLSPRALASAAAAMLAVVVLQAGVIGRLMVAEGPQTYTTASGPAGAAAAGTYALVGFAPGATMAEVTAFLAARSAAIVDGPKPGGLYRVRIADEALPPAERDARLAALRGETGLVRLALPEPERP